MPPKKTAKPRGIRRHVVKRKGHKETYDEKKVYAACFAAALNCHYSDIRSEKIADTVTKKVTAWIKNKSTVEADDIRDQILKNLRDADVALMYKHHLDLS